MWAYFESHPYDWSMMVRLSKSRDYNGNYGFEKYGPETYALFPAAN